MTDPHIHLRKLLVGALLLLWCMGNLSDAMGYSEQMMPRVSEDRSRKNGPAGDTGSGRGWTKSIQDPPPLGLAYTADEMKDRMRRIPTPSAGPVEQKRTTRRPLGAIKRETADFVTANCPDLRLTLVQLLRKVNALKKRENSMFSGLSDAEKEELAEANEKLTALMTVLKARCSAPDSD
jgi:hypothetical protein